MNTWKTELIEDGRDYTFSVVERDIGIAQSTLRLWRNSGRLKTYENNQSLCKGEWLRLAVQNRATQ